VKPSTKRRSGPRNTERGLTVVELLVTLVVASAVSAATFTFFAGQQRIYDVQTEILNVQQNLWASMETLTRYVRVAGSGMTGCVRPDSDLGGPDQGDPVPGAAAMPQTGLRVWQDPNFSRIPPLWIQNGASGAPDIITVAYGDGASGAFNDATLAVDVPNGQSTAPIELIPGQIASFLQDEFVLLVDRGQDNLDRGCMLFQVTGFDVPNNRLLHSGASSSWNTLANIAPMVPFTFDGDADPLAATAGVRSFGQLIWVQFAVDRTVTPPTLTMNRLDTTQGPQVLAEGIEDLQIAYACDRVPAAALDGVLSEGTDAATRLVDEWVYNTAGDVPPNGCNRPDAIRITLMARSINADNNLADLTGNAKAASEDGVAGTADRFRHRLVTTTVYPRN
jgi:hypothetical protein